MTDERQAGMIEPVREGEEAEAEPASPVSMNGHASQGPEATSVDPRVAMSETPQAGTAATPRDDLQWIATNEEMPAALRIIAHRLLMAERGPVDVVHLGQAHLQMQHAFEEMRQQVIALSQQRSFGEMQMERSARGAALDLAIKALPDALKSSERATETIITFAGAFLDWIKAGA